MSAPCWAALVGLVNQGRAATGQPTLNSTTPTDVQQAVYSLPQGDFNAVSETAGYNTVTGLGTPRANLLVPALVAYQQSGDTYAWVAPTTNASATQNQRRRYRQWDQRLQCPDGDGPAPGGAAVGANLLPFSSPLAHSPVETGLDAVNVAAGNSAGGNWEMADSAAGTLLPAFTVSRFAGAAIQVPAALQTPDASLSLPSGSNYVLPASLEPSLAPLDNPAPETATRAIANPLAAEPHEQRLGRLDAAAAYPFFSAGRVDDPAVGAFSDLALPGVGLDLNDLALQSVLNEWTPEAS